MVRKILRTRVLRRLGKQTEALRRVPQELQTSIKTYLQDYPNHQLRQHVFNMSLLLSGRTEEEPQTELVTYRPPAEMISAADDYFKRAGPLSPVPRRYSSKKPRLRYDEKQVAAYVAAKMPAVYTVIQNVFCEIQRRLPDFKPVTVVDFGAGPGTALWALSDVWPKVVKQVNMVETSPAMLAASKKILEDLEDAPAMFNHRNLRILSTKTRHAGHDLVIACHSIGELPTVKDQITAARQLWALTSDILVIIEPGTSEGSLTVRGIRAHILAIEKKKLRRRRKFLTGSDGESLPLIASNVEGAVAPKVDLVQAEKDRIKFEEEIRASRAGAHVVAPCPHDGVCPMDGTEQFCHFVQRLERTLTQRVAKKHSKKMLRGYEDEKYTYVVLRRGPRPRMKWPLDKVRLELDLPEEPVNELLVDYDQLDLGTDDENDEEFDENDEDDEENEAEDDAEEEAEAEAEAETEEDEDEREENPEGSEQTRMRDAEKNDVHDLEVKCEEPEIEDVSHKQIQPNEEAREENKHEDKALSDINDIDDHNEDEYVSSGGEDEECTETVANMSGGWGRVIFKPYRRGRQVILDVCRSTERDGSAGSFDRLTVTRGKHRVLHKEAKKIRWGDIWACTSSRRTFRDNRDNRIPLCKRSRQG